MGNAVDRAKNGPVPKLVEGHLGFIRKQTGETCAAMSIAFMAYIFISKYYVGKNQQIKDIGTYDIQEIVFYHIQDGFYKSPDTEGIPPETILQAMQAIAKTLNCAVISDKQNTSYAELKKLVRTRNTIHAVLIGVTCNEKFDKFITHFNDHENKTTVFTTQVAANVELPSNYKRSISGIHAMVIVDCYDDQNEYVKGANSYGTSFGDEGYFYAKYDSLDWEQTMFTFKKNHSKPNNFVFDAVGKAKEQTISANSLIGNTISVKVPCNFTVGQVKQMIAKKVGIDPSQIDLSYKGKLLEDDNMTEHDIKYTPFIPFRVFYHSYDNSKEKITLDGQKFVTPGIYKVLGAHPLTHKIFSNGYALSIMLHNPKNKTISHLGPFYNVPHDYNFNQISEMLKKYHNLSLNLGSGIFFKENPNKTGWLQIDPTFAMKYQIRHLHSIPYAVFNLQS